MCKCFSVHLCAQGGCSVLKGACFAVFPRVVLSLVFSSVCLPQNRMLVLAASWCASVQTTSVFSRVSSVAAEYAFSEAPVVQSSAPPFELCRGGHPFSHARTCKCDACWEHLLAASSRALQVSVALNRATISATAVPPGAGLK